MARKERFYEFGELSDEAQQRAIDDWRGAGHDFDDSDAHSLTEQFQGDLEEKGFSNSKKQWVFWSLGYCQGDGVCFEGRVDPEILFKQKGFGKYKALKDGVSIQVTIPDHKYCHWNGMNVEVTEDLRYESFMNEGDVGELRDWELETNRVEREWEQATRGRRGVLDWFPGKPEAPKLSSRVRRAKERAEKKVADLEALIPELEKAVEEWVKQLSRDLEKMGYEEIEYRGSSDAIAEYFQANEWKFTAEGERQ